MGRSRDFMSREELHRMLPVQSFPDFVSKNILFIYFYVRRRFWNLAGLTLIKSYRFRVLGLFLVFLGIFLVGSRPDGD